MGMNVFMRTIKVALIPAILFFPFSCSTEKYFEKEFSEKKPLILHALLESNNNETKTSLQELNVVWDKGDIIGVMPYSITNDGPSIPFLLQDDYIGKASGSFCHLNDSEYDYVLGFNYYAVFPYDKNASSEERPFYTPDNRVHFFINAQQTFRENSFGINANVAVGKNEGDGLTLLFRNLCGLLLLQIKGNQTINSITVTGSQNDILWGRASVDMSYGKEGPSLVFDDLTGVRNTVVLSCPGVKLKEDAISKFYIAIPPGCLKDGFTVIVRSADGQTMTLHGAASEKNRIKRSVITPMPEVTFVPDILTPNGDASHMEIVHDAQDFAAPILSGDNRAWKVFWGDGLGIMYLFGITHSYTHPGPYKVLLETEGATQVSIRDLVGVQSINFSDF